MIRHSVENLVFVEDDLQASSCRGLPAIGSRTKLMALTAQSVQALEELGLAHESVADHVDMTRLAATEEQFNLDSFALAVEIESFISERYAHIGSDQTGFLSDQGYYIQYAVSALATRCFLMRESILSVSPESVTVFDGKVEAWFEGLGYRSNPWVSFLQSYAKDLGIVLEVAPRPNAATDAVGKSHAGHHSDFRHLKALPQRLYRYGRRKAGSLVHRLLPFRRRSLQHTRRLLLSDLENFHGLRLLMAESLGYDWEPILSILRLGKNSDCFSLDRPPMEMPPWAIHFSPSVQILWTDKVYQLKIDPPMAAETEIRTLSELFDNWVHQRSERPELNVLGMNLFPPLEQLWRDLAVRSPALVRYCDELANQALDVVKPHAVCFFHIAWLHVKRLARQCHKRGVPVVCYQHGPVYGTHLVAKNEQIDPAYADYFLTYGSRIRPRANPAFPVRAQYVPVGSCRVESMAHVTTGTPSRRSGPTRILWIAECSVGNTVGGTFQLEDTRRYLLQKKCLRILDEAGNSLTTYRPYHFQVQTDGTTRWLEQSRFRNVAINVSQPLETLIRNADAVISDNSSANVWNETMALGKPLILYCNPDQTLLQEHFSADLETACFWCKSETEFAAAVHRLADETATFMAELKQFDTAAYLREYVLHHGDGSCVQRVLQFLGTVCHHGDTVDGHYLHHRQGAQHGQA